MWDKIKVLLPSNHQSGSGILLFPQGASLNPFEHPVEKSLGSFISPLDFSEGASNCRTSPEPHGRVSVKKLTEVVGKVLLIN